LRATSICVSPASSRAFFGEARNARDAILDRGRSENQSIARTEMTAVNIYEIDFYAKWSLVSAALNAPSERPSPEDQLAELRAAGRLLLADRIPPDLVRHSGGEIAMATQVSLTVFLRNRK